MANGKKNPGVAGIERELNKFLINNKFAKIKKEGKRYVIDRPWNDQSIAFSLEAKTKDKLIDTLNNVILPPRFTAIYHLDSNVMEYIYALLPKENPYREREFNFKVEKDSYRCKFSESTEKLLTISRSFVRTDGYPHAHYRNLSQFRAYSDRKGKLVADVNYYATREPVSFFVEGFKAYDEEKILEVSRHLNFFMTYYDRHAPTIDIHSIENDTGALSKVRVMLESKFPHDISTKRHNSFLLDIATAAHDTRDIRLSFLYYYQILEYTAFYYIESKVKNEMMKTICVPHIHVDPGKCLEKLLEVMTELRVSDEKKIAKVIQDYCCPDVIWEEIILNKDHFAKKNQFDGGFKMDLFIDKDMTRDSFVSMWTPKTSDKLRHIRNALVHGRESRHGFAIAPTLKNDIKLRPWLSLIRRIAEQIIICNPI